MPWHSPTLILMDTSTLRSTGKRKDQARTPKLFLWFHTYCQSIGSKMYHFLSLLLRPPELGDLLVSILASFHSNLSHNGLTFFLHKSYLSSSAMAPCYLGHKSPGLYDRLWGLHIIYRISLFRVSCFNHLLASFVPDTAPLVFFPHSRHFLP